MLILELKYKPTSFSNDALPGYCILFLVLKMAIFRAATVLLILCLFTVGSIPTAGHTFPGTMHWVVHLATYALIAFTFGLGWQNMQATYIAAIVAAIGVIHEMTEIITHSHVFEFKDAAVNGFGALIGVAILSVLQKFRRKEKPHGYLWRQRN